MTDPVKPTNAAAYPKAGTLSAAVLCCLRDGAVGSREIGQMMGISRKTAAGHLSNMKLRGLAIRMRSGYWQLASRETAVRVYGETPEEGES